MKEEIKLATFGGGCFWCTEAIFQQLEGVKKVESGYSGGKIKNPTYKEVCSGLTGHAEVVQITYDSSIISYKELMMVHLTTHNPTTLNRQGGDVGTQYRSTVFYRSEKEKEMAEEVIHELKDSFDSMIVTALEPFEAFFKAEEYHQNYYQENSTQGYCQAIINPKLAKFRKAYSDKLKKEM